MIKSCFLIFSVFFLFSCKNEPQKAKEIKWTTKMSTEMNKNLAVQEDLDIRMFLENHKSWKTKKTGTGLRYYIYKEGSGDSAKSQMTATVRYEINTLDGTLCYKTEEDEIETFKIDKSDVETGVQEGIKKMKVGDKAKFIVPSHIGHGLLGDMDKIPPLTVLVIDLELIDLK
jgi:FKBP-type peptidyl-prolyl cis-trans isomerase